MRPPPPPHEPLVSHQGGGRRSDVNGFAVYVSCLFKDLFSVPLSLLFKDSGLFSQTLPKECSFVSDSM